MGTQQPGISGLAVDSMDQQMDHHQRVRLVVRLGIRHGCRTVAIDNYGESCGFSGNLEDLYVIGQDACTETKN